MAVHADKASGQKCITRYPRNSLGLRGTSCDCSEMQTNAIPIIVHQAKLLMLDKLCSSAPPSTHVT
ncbi:unnamed protein product [Gadus morhua 'NCC']